MSHSETETPCRHCDADIETDGQYCPNCTDTCCSCGMEIDQDNAICPNCNGSGEGMHDGTRCSRCGGGGNYRPRYEPDPDEYYDRMRCEEN